MTFVEEAAIHISPLAAPSKDFARRLMSIGENRLELLMVEVQEERERLLHAILLALAVALFAFLAGVALTIAVVLLFWSLSPVGVLLGLTAVYVGAAVLLYGRFAALLHNWKSFPATIGELRKDRACLEKCLA
ncbi:MAG TPA: phage holin family protein [Methylomirabilota bacterium]|nr:phage holin family protein [Methylomirabilota bacterium]